MVYLNVITNLVSKIGQSSFIMYLVFFPVITWMFLEIREFVQWRR